MNFMGAERSYSWFKSEILKIIDSNNLIKKNEMLLFKFLNAKILLEKHNF